MVIEKTKNIRSPLKQEITNLRINIARDQERLDNAEMNFWENGGICCPFCGVPGYSELASLQDRRQLRIDQLLVKIEKDSGSRTKPEPESAVCEPYNPEELYPPLSSFK